MGDKQDKVVINNKKASFEYHLSDCAVAGIQLQGTEIKSIRRGKASLQESYCFFKDEELFVKNMHITEYEQGNIYNHEPKRTRKLLLKKRELQKLLSKVKERGMTIIPKKLFINDRGFAKLEICLAKGKKLYDKREAIKRKDLKRELNRNLKF